MDKLKAEKSYNPKVGFEFFYSDPDGDSFVYFKSEQERNDAVKEAIAERSENVENIIVGKITGASAKVDVTIRPTQLDEDNCDEEGVYWDSDCDYTCNYEIKPVGYVCPTDKAGK
tara:strand:+ start:273 stop:617 length:345 start_codon:yes stop_codon:yes gene_type:complete